MICLEISVNGEVVSLAGHEHAENLSASIELLPGSSPMILCVNGLVNTNAEHHDFLAWETPCIKEGDQISIRVVDSTTPDKPIVARAGEGEISESCSAGPVCFLCGNKHFDVDSMVAGRRGGYICKPCIQGLVAGYTQ